LNHVVFLDPLTNPALLFLAIHSHTPNLGFFFCSFCILDPYHRIPCQLIQLLILIGLFGRDSYHVGVCIVRQFIQGFCFRFLRCQLWPSSKHLFHP
jgi:hypothetical protein